MAEHWFRWSLDDDDRIWVLHQCHLLVAFPLPNTEWWLVDGLPWPSLHCGDCRCHRFVGAEDRVPMSDIDAALEARRG